MRSKMRKIKTISILEPRGQSQEQHGGEQCAAGAVNGGQGAGGANEYHESTLSLSLSACRCICTHSQGCMTSQATI